MRHDALADLPDALVSAAESGDRDAQYGLAAGLVERRRPLDALPWLRKAAEQGHLDAQLEAGRVLLYFGPRPEGLAECVQWLRRAEDGGSPAAACLLATLALGGIAEPRDFHAINRRLLRSAQAGHTPAVRAVALYFGRSPTPASQQLAVQLLQQAAHKGDPVSAQLLAQRFAHGEGVPRDPAAAQALHAQLAAVGVAPLPEVPSHMAALPGGPMAIAFERLLQLPPAHTLHDAPAVRVFDHLFTPEECRYLIAMSAPKLQRSRVYGEEDANPATHDIRTSREAAFDGITEDFALNLLQLRMAAAGGAELVQGEPLIVLNYQPGEQYHPHRDYLAPSALAANRPDAGQRRTTVCVYLNPVAEGGETEFPVFGLRSSPVPGRALVFDSLTPAGEPDPDSLHAGRPVRQGEKWLATLWLRQRAYRDF